MTAAKSTKFTKFQISDSALPGGTFGDVAEVKSFDGPSSSAPTIVVSSFDSAAVEKIQALADAGQVQLGLNFIGKDVGQQLLNGLHYSGDARECRIIFNDHDTDPTTVTFLATVSGYAPSGATDAAYELSATLDVSGVPEWEFAPA